MRRPILNHTKRSELVYEPFLGSGTSLAAAELTERVCLGVELDPKYVDVIVQRWQTLADWSSELRLIQKESEQEAKKPAAAGAGRAEGRTSDATR
jgi:DNA modification methylase